jgi:hypothetical protein
MHIEAVSFAAGLAGGTAGRRSKNAQPGGVLSDPEADKGSLRVSIATRAMTSGPSAVNAKSGSKVLERAFDCVQLLIHGPFVCRTNRPLDTYTQADLAASAQKLRQSGCDVSAAAAEMQRKKGPCAWARIRPGATPGAWIAAAKWVVPGTTLGNELKVLSVDIGPFPDPSAAARAADAATLVLEGPRERLNPPLNFPLASYSEGEIQAAHQALQAWVGTEEFQGAYKKHEAHVLEQFDNNIMAVNEVGGAVVGEAECLEGVFVPSLYVWLRCVLRSVLPWFRGSWGVLGGLANLVVRSARHRRCVRCGG